MKIIRNDRDNGVYAFASLCVGDVFTTNMDGRQGAVFIKTANPYAVRIPSYTAFDLTNSEPAVFDASDDVYPRNATLTVEMPQ